MMKLLSFNSFVDKEVAMKKVNLICVLLLFLIIAFNNSVAITFFPDVLGHWSESYVYWATNEAELFKGYEDGTFKPDNNITRAEYIVILNRLLHGKNMYESMDMPEDFGNAIYDDIDSSFWGYRDIMEMSRYIENYASIDISLKSIFKGNFLYPGKPITRYEAAALARAITTPPVKLEQKQFTDVTQDLEFCDAIMELSSNGIILGYEDGTFRPFNNITRAESATILKRIHNDLDYLSVNYLQFNPIKISDLEYNFPLFELTEDEMYENQDNQKFVNAVTTLEYLSFVEHIAHEEKHLYDPNPVETLWELKEEQYDNIIGNNYYLIVYDENLTFDKKIDLVKEALDYYNTVQNADISGMDEFLLLIKDYVRYEDTAVEKENNINDEAPEDEGIEEKVQEETTQEEEIEIIVSEPIEEDTDIVEVGIEETEAVEEIQEEPGEEEAQQEQSIDGEVQDESPEGEAIEEKPDEEETDEEVETEKLTEDLSHNYITREQMMKAAEKYYNAVTETSTRFNIGVLIAELYLMGDEKDKAIEIYNELLGYEGDILVKVQLITNYGFLLYEIEGVDAAVNYLNEAWKELKLQEGYYENEFKIDTQMTAMIKQLLMKKL